MKSILSNARRPVQSESSEFREGRLAYSNGISRDENPYLESSSAASRWDAGWLEGEKAREKFLSNQKDLAEETDTHPIWHIILLVGLIVIFFPWSLLLLFLIFGWDGTVQILRGLVLSTIGIAVLVIWLAIVLLIIFMLAVILLNT